MTAVAASSRGAAPALLSADRLLRDFLFLATLLLSWFTVAPFPDLSDPRLLGPRDGGDLLGQVAVVLLTGALAAFVVSRRSWLVSRAVTLPLVLAFAAFAVSALLSAYPDVAGRRLVLAAFTTFQAAVVLLLPYGREHFARLLAVAAILVLVACYAGVALLPQLSIHHAGDVAEPELAGDWRGFFTHKNGAGANMVVLIFIGIFVCRAWNRAVGIAIVVAAAIFLYFTNSKSPINLLPIVLGLSYLITRTRSSLAAFALAAGAPVALGVLTVGSVMFQPIRDLTAAWMPDPTFTGRNVIWQFAVDKIAERPLFGFGFEAFWGMRDLLAQWTYQESWGYRASDAHNGYLNVAVTTGLIGLALALWWIFVQPFVDYRRARASNSDPALATFFIQIWLFALCLATFESVFFVGGSALWLLMIMSIIGLRFQTAATSVR